MTKLYREDAIGSISAAQAIWEANELAATLANRPEEKLEYETECGIPLKRVYTAADVADIPADALGFREPIHSPEDHIQRCIGDAPSTIRGLPGSEIRKPPTSATNIWFRPDKPVSLPISIYPHCLALIQTIPWHLAKSVDVVSPLTRSTMSIACSTGSISRKSRCP